MKKENRNKWLALTKIEIHFDGPDGVEAETSPTSLCHFCRYASWCGSCEDTELDCNHPINTISENPYDTWEGVDCWGFANGWPWDIVVEYVSQRMQGQG